MQTVVHADGGSLVNRARCLPAFRECFLLRLNSSETAVMIGGRQTLLILPANGGQSMIL